MNRDLLDKLNQAEEAGQVAFIRQLCEQILAEEPNNGAILIRYASCLIDLSLYDRASFVLDHAEKVVPRDRRHWVYAERGHLQMAMGDHEFAEKSYLSAHELDADDATYLIYAGVAAFARGDIPGAEEFARKASECTEGCIDEAYFNLGGYLVAQKKYDEARTCYLRAIEIDPDYQIAKFRIEDLDRLREFQGEQSRSPNN